MVQNLLRLWNELLESKQQVRLILEKSHHSAHKFLCWDTIYHSMSRKKKRQSVDIKDSIKNINKHSKYQILAGEIIMSWIPRSSWSVNYVLGGDLHQAVVALQNSHKVLIDLGIVFVGLFDWADIVNSILIHGCVLWRMSCCCCTQNRRRGRTMEMQAN